MALTISNVLKPTVIGNKRLSIKEVTFDSSYAEGGESFTPAKAGLKKIDAAWAVVTHGDEAKSETVEPASVYYASEKLHVIDSESGKELAKEKNLEKFKCLVFSIGR